MVVDERAVLEAAALAALPPVEAAGEQQQGAAQRSVVADEPEVDKQAAGVDILEVAGKQADVEGKSGAGTLPVAASVAGSQAVQIEEVQTSRETTKTRVLESSYINLLTLSSLLCFQ